ncbi:MFS transporter [Silvimonas iriomotensis]|uniref:MFS transporter n=1 Tax=Silvimonas iriomotensis TaxID=449662 RepID=A0ABQ2P8S4_9NEIS|nr:MFS transporter [Silvimonas iriomotensis]GGP21145.1 hypothetical protein GCM10010970_19040 [Silvimonas iriomotensis]
MPNSRFLPLLCGHFFSQFGGWVNFLAILNIAVYRFHGTATDLLILNAASLLPSVLLTGLVGRISATYKPKTVLCVSTLVVVLATLGLLWAPSFAVFIAVVCVKYIAVSFADPAINVQASASIPTAALGRAFSQLSLSRNIAKILAPAIGALVAAMAGDQHTMMLSVLLLAVATVAFVFVPDAAQQPRTAASQRPPGERTPAWAAWPFFASVVVYGALTLAVNSQFALVLKNCGYGSSAVGILMSCAAAGGILGGLVLARRSPAGASLRGLIGLGMVAALVFLALGGALLLPPQLGIFGLGVCFFATGLNGAAIAVKRNVFLVAQFGDQVGVATATLQSVQQAIQFLAPFLGAALVSHLAAPNVFWTLALQCLVLSGALLLLTGLRASGGLPVRQRA